MNAILAIVISLSSLVSPFKPLLWNCEDKDVTPCYMWDEGSYMVVKSFDPYKASKIKICKAKPYKNCLGKADSKNRRPKY